ncbi:MAG: hypothetical protein GY788_11485, partial [bacterium]|nr:hypothetical protein [bacterium]
MTRLPDLTWYVVEAKPGLGMMAEHNLRQQAYRLVSPWYVVERRSRRGGMVIDRRAWFPGYLFVGVRPGQAVAPINNTRGVAGIVPRGMPPMPLPWVAMRTLLEVVDLDGYVDDPGLDDATKDNPKP